jgi:hypothetical protein
MRPRIPVDVGMRFGRLLITSRGPNVVYPHAQHRRWWCRCECGASILVRAYDLRGGKTRGCGCGVGEQHGRSRTKEYLIWNSMKHRCNNAKDPGYKNYGGRGIRVCERWSKSFSAFLADMGPCPRGLSIERENNDGNYEPGNCRWATRLEQNRNKRPRKYPPRPTQCPRGHLYTPENSYKRPNRNYVECRTCMRMRTRRDATN